MDRTILTNYINSLVPMSPEGLEKLVAVYEPLSVDKGDFLVEENKVGKYAYFLATGIIRTYVNSAEGQEVTTNIFSPPCFVTDFFSFFRQLPVSENVEALTDCNLWRIRHDRAQHHFHALSEFREFGRMMLAANYARLHDRMIGMIKDTAESRYLKLLRQFPDIYQHVPLKIIASYLGITDSSLSRIRREIMPK